MLKRFQTLQVFSKNWLSCSKWKVTTWWRLKPQLSSHSQRSFILTGTRTSQSWARSLTSPAPQATTGSSLFSSAAALHPSLPPETKLCKPTQFFLSLWPRPFSVSCITSHLTRPEVRLSSRAEWWRACWRSSSGQARSSTTSPSWQEQSGLLTLSPTLTCRSVSIF